MPRLEEQREFPPNQRVILLVGLPRSGKSTWAREMMEMYGYPIVEPDAIHLALHGKRFDASSCDEVWKTAHLMAKALLLAGHYNIIIDATNTNEKARQRWARALLDINPKLHFECVVFATSVKKCKERAVKTGQEDLLPVIDRMAAGADFSIVPDEQEPERRCTHRPGLRLVK